MKKIAIINYGLGNLRSVYNALEFIGADPFITENSQGLNQCDGAILPGVGAFGDGMEHLRDNGWVEAIHEYALEKQKPFLGICLGMQLLASTGTEHGDHAGLDLIKGKVVRLETGDRAARIPHIGWNSVNIAQGTKSYADSEDEQDFYFVHSYVFEPDESAVISGKCTHGKEFVASVEKDNIWGAQYHPEKSQKAGLAYLQNFLKV